MNLINYWWIQLAIKVNSHVHSNLSLFTKGLAIFTMVNLSNYIQNLMKHKMNLDAYWCNVCCLNYIGHLRVIYIT
jgi:hypothetical protein